MKCIFWNKLKATGLRGKNFLRRSCGNVYLENNSTKRSSIETCFLRLFRVTCICQCIKFAVGAIELELIVFCYLYLYVFTDKKF